MQQFSRRWLGVVNRPRIRSWTLPLGADEPLLSWITPPVPSRLEEIFLAGGRRREFEPGEYIYPPSMPLSYLTLLLEGVAGRTFGSRYNQAKEGMAIAIPRRICGGNHTFFSGRPGNGRYFAVSPVSAVTLPNGFLKEMMRDDHELRGMVEVQLECCIQSDRIGFGAISVLPVRQRILLYFLSWAFAYGRLVERAGEEFVHYPALLSQTQIALVASASLVHVKRSFGEMKEEGSFEAVAGMAWLKASLLDDMWRWLAMNEEPVSGMPRPADWRRYLAGVPAAA